jgi:hypothetical protein
LRRKPWQPFVLLNGRAVGEGRLNWDGLDGGDTILTDDVTAVTYLCRKLAEDRR